VTCSLPPSLPPSPPLPQAFGNFQNVEGVRYSKAERSRFGRFYYR